MNARPAAAGGPWHCDVAGTFAHRTCTVRWPAIVRDLARDVPIAAAVLCDLADEIERGVVRRLRPTTPEHRRWHAIDAFVGGPWTALPWYVGEAFLYARIREATGHHLDGGDPFLAAKLREERTLGRGADSDVGVPDGADGELLLSEALWASLWGNRGDLSLPEAQAHTGADADDLVVDERADALGVLRDARRVALVLDNAGRELAADLALARVLSARGVAVTLLPKDAPFFVSDAMAADIDRLVRSGHDPGGADVVVDPFFTGPEFLRSEALPAALRGLLGAVDVAIVKGDCNYRRLVGDAPWRADDQRSFADVVDLPTTVIALRTLKAEVLVGAGPGRASAAAARGPSWLVSGRFGVVQVARRSTRNLR
jgi:uncharacterized protein with ATP-grasp and redox domains